MKKFISALKRIFRSKKEKVICFTVSNYESAYKKNPNCIEKAKRELAHIGALPAKIDFPRKLFCVTLANPNVKIKQIQSILKKNRFNVSIKN